MVNAQVYSWRIANRKGILPICRMLIAPLIDFAVVTSAGLLLLIDPIHQGRICSVPRINRTAFPFRRTSFCIIYAMWIRASNPVIQENTVTSCSLTVLLNSPNLRRKPFLHFFILFLLPPNSKCDIIIADNTVGNFF